MESVDILLKYFNFYSLYFDYISNSNNKSYIERVILNLNNIKEQEKYNYIDEIDKLVSVLNIVEIIDYYKNNQDNVDDIVKPNFDKGLDYVLYDILFYINKINLTLMNNKVKSINIPLSMDIRFNDLNINLKNVLDYLEVTEDEIDKDLVSDLNNFADLNKFKNLAILIKTDNGMKRILFDKIEDKNVLVSIILHSNIDIINEIVNIFESEKSNLNKVVSNIPSIFIKDLVSSKCKFNNIVCSYDNFINNYKLIKDNGMNFKRMLNSPMFLISDYNKNINLINELDSLEASING